MLAYWPGSLWLLDPAPPLFRSGIHPTLPEAWGLVPSRLPGLPQALGSLLTRGRGGPPNATCDHTTPTALAAGALVDITCPSHPTKGRGRGHAVTFPFNSLAGPPVVQGWGAGCPATLGLPPQSPD